MQKVIAKNMYQIKVDFVTKWRVGLDKIVRYWTKKYLTRTSGQIQDYICDCGCRKATI